MAETPRKVAEAATIPDILSLDDVCLLGTVGKNNDLSAMLRHPEGSIHVVKSGDWLGTRLCVTSIDTGRAEIWSPWGRVTLRVAGV
ncbi:MAG: hypothetical protein ACU0CI_12905 [Shimia sp.]